MEHHCCGDKHPYDLKRKHLDIGFVEFMMIESGEEPFFCGIALPFSVPEKAYRGIKDAYYHFRQIPHTHSTMSDYRS